MTLIDFLKENHLASRMLYVHIEEEKRSHKNDDVLLKEAMFSLITEYPNYAKPLIAKMVDDLLATCDAKAINNLIKEKATEKEEE